MKHESRSLALWSEELVILSQELNQRVWACKESVWENVPKKEPVPWGQTRTLILARPPAEGPWTSSRAPLRFSLLICLRAEWRKWYSDRKLSAHNKCPPKCRDRSMAIFTVKFVGQLKEHMICRLSPEHCPPSVIRVNWAKSMNSFWGQHPPLWNGGDTRSTTHRIP